MNYNKHNRKITKISEIEKIIKCSCGKGTVKLVTIYVDPKNGKVDLSYKYCTAPFCSYKRGILLFTDIIISELILGEIEKED